MNIRKICNPHQIAFHERNHVYKHPNGSFLVSATTKLKEYQHPFPSDAAEKYAKKHSMSLEKVLYHWEEQRRLGTEIGSWLHIQIENQINNKVPDLSYLLTKEDSEQKQLIKNQYLDNYKVQIKKYLLWRAKYDHLGNEIIVGNNKLAGQIDELNVQLINDYKQDKVIKYENKWQKFKYPFDDLDDCNWNKYCLQINLYHALLPEEVKEQFTEPHKIIKFDRYSQDFEVLEIPDLQHRIKDIL